MFIEYQVKERKLFKNNNQNIYSTGIYALRSPQNNWICGNRQNNNAGKYQYTFWKYPIQICPNDQTKLIKCSLYKQKIEEPKAFKNTGLLRVVLLCVKIHCIVTTMMEPFMETKETGGKALNTAEKGPGKFDSKWSVVTKYPQKLQKEEDD